MIENELTTEQAIQVLEKHNEWRRGGEGEMINPKKIGIAIDLILSDLKQKNELLAKLDLKKVEGDCLDRSSAATEIEQVVKKLLPIKNSDNNNEKPYLFYEGEKYYFGEEYEFSDDEFNWIKAYFESYDHMSGYPFCYKHIRKIDHTSKYKSKLEELKIQAEKDGVNLKELI